MLAPGTTWQARALADAADTITANPDSSEVENAERMAYARGVADVLRAVAGDIDPHSIPALDEIYETFSNSL